MSRISVVIATHNRLHLVLGAIQSVLAQQSPSLHEVIVVDNASTDGTSEALSIIASHAWRLTVIREPRLGLSVARNSGLAAATGEVIAFIDDDVRPELGWLDAIADIFDRREDVTAVAGRVSLELPNSLPPWIGTEFAGLLAACDYGDAEREIFGFEVPVGANMAARASALRRLGGFNETLGYKGNNLTGSEEVDLFYRMRCQGGCIWYSPDIAVRHLVPSERTRFRWMFKRVMAEGRGRALIDETARRGLGVSRVKGGLREILILRKRSTTLSMMRQRSFDPVKVEVLRMAFAWGATVGGQELRVQRRSGAAVRSRGLQ